MSPGFGGERLAQVLQVFLVLLSPVPDVHPADHGHPLCREFAGPLVRRSAIWMCPGNPPGRLEQAAIEPVATAGLQSAGGAPSIHPLDPFGGDTIPWIPRAGVVAATRKGLGNNAETRQSTG